MKMDIRDEHGDPVEFEIVMETRPGGRVGVWTFRFTFENHFETVVKLDRYEVKAMLSALTDTL